MKRVIARHHAALRPPKGFLKLVTASIGPAGEAVAIWTDPDARQHLNDTAPAPRVTGAVTITTAGSTRTITIDQFDGFKPIAQPMPDGRVLLVTRSATWRPSGPDHNAAIYSSDGSLERTGCVGDSIEHVRTTQDGHIWLGFDDMGVYGSNGWDNPGPRPFGHPGLIRFSSDLELDWAYPGDDRAYTERRVSSIDDCEALALVNDTVWIYPNSDYPVIEVQANGGLPHGWWPATDADRAPLGVQTLAVAGHLVGIVGGYADKDAGRVVLVDLNGDQWIRRQSVQLVLPNGDRPTHRTKIYGHDDTLHLFNNRDWYVTNLTACL